MKTRHRRGRPALCFAAVLAALIGPLDAADIYRARMLTGKVDQPMVNIQVEVESWTTPEEIRHLQGVLAQSGVNPFLAAFGAMNKGVVRFMFARGWNLPIHAAQILPTDKGKKIQVFLNRQGWDPGSFQKGGRHFFMVIELKLNEKGKGDGRFYEDAQIKMDSMLGKIEMETYESAPKILPNAQEVIKKK